MGRAANRLFSNNNDSEVEDQPAVIEQLGTVVNQATEDSRTVFLSGEVNEASTAVTIAHLIHLANISHDPIYLVISTYGGEVDQMFSIYDVIKYLPCSVRTIALGKVMSAGVLLLSSGEKGHRLIGESARIMIHPLSAGAYGNVFDIKNERREVERHQNLMIKQLSRETNMSKSKLLKEFKKKKDWYITPKKAIKLGIVDGIIGKQVV